jgi:oligopeptide/dipeptide ABC transporter ATP-binding protein
MNGNLVEIEQLTKTFPGKHGLVRAVDGVDLEIPRGQTLALVGESGSGKSTLGRCVLRLLKPDSGRIVVAGQEVGRLSRQELRRFRSTAQMVFQDPFGSLNPRMRVRDTLEEPLKLHTELEKPARRARVLDALRRVHLDESYASRFPSELSGGEQQRVGIARAIISEPALIVLDEPTAALDARVRKGIYELLGELQRNMGLTYLLISHDLASVWGVSDRVAVMYMGRIVEYGPRAEVFLRPGHPYTVALMSAVPHIAAPGVDKAARLVLEGELGGGPVEGCRFYGRCPLGVEGLCTDKRPDLFQITTGHAAACFRIEEVPGELGAFRGSWSHVDAPA